MLGRKKQQLTFTDINILQTWEQKPLVPEDSFYYGLSQADDIFQDELFADCYASCGRPSIPPSRLVKVILLQFHDRVSDREAEQRALYDLRWKVALNLSLGEAGFDHTDLSRFRARLLLNKKERTIFEKILKAAEAKGLLPAKCVQQIMDSTYVLGAGAVQDTYTLIRLAIRKLLSALIKRPDFPELRLNLNYQGKGKPKINWEDPAERERLLNQLYQDALTIISATEGMELSCKERELKDLLLTVATQDIEQKEDDSVTIKRGVAKDRVISTTDPEMRHGRKSHSRLFDGYKSHTAMDKESEFITAVTVTPGNIHDSEATFALVDQQPEERRPEEAIFDTAYGTGRVREEMATRQIKVISPVPEGIGKDGCFPKSAFEIDLDRQICRCPAGQIAPEKIYDKKTGRLKVFLFSPEQCQNCPLLNQCTRNKKGRRTVTVNTYERYLQEGRVFQKTEEFAGKYPERCKIERKQAEMVMHGLRKARYVGLAKVTLQALLVATVVNFKRYWKLLNQKVTAAVPHNDIAINGTTPVLASG
ncbi:IS1182 family transposase [Desulfofundulus sp.]|uniref:IS1182 family transposase n=1 Tax=Desulfofundulus sp. TaxID=2282750 RepID=UPI003C77FBD3